MEMTVFDRVCRHCRYNPTALPPFVEMKEFQVTDLNKTKLYKYAKKNKLRIHCVFCRAVRDLGDKMSIPLVLNDDRFG